MSKDPTNTRTKFAVGFLVCIILLAAILRIKLYYFPSTQVVPEIDEDVIFNQFEEDLFSTFSETTLEQSTAGTADAEVAIDNNNKIQKVTPVDSSQIILRHVYTHALGEHRLSHIQALDDGYVQSYVSGREIFLQRYNADFQASGDPVRVGESVTELDVVDYRPRLFVNDQFVIVLSVRSVNNQFIQHVNIFDHTLTAINDWDAWRDEPGSGRNIASAHIVMVDDEIMIATASNDSGDALSVSLAYYDQSGQLTREHVINNVGQLRGIQVDAHDVILISQQDNQTLFSKLTDSEADLQQFGLTDVSLIDTVRRSGDYVFLVGTVVDTDGLNVDGLNAVTITPLSKNLSTVFAPTLITQSNSIEHSIDMNTNKLFVSYAVPVTEVQADQTVTTYHTYVDEYEITPHDITQ